MPLSAYGPLRVLIVEDDPNYARLLREYLHEDNPEHVVETMKSLVDATMHWQDNGVPDIILLDLGLPDADGVDAVTGMRAVASRCPIVVLSGADDLEVALGAMREGAQEYLVKGQSDDVLLPRAMRYAIERKRRDDFEQLLVGVASHDLRSPLQTISLGCDLLESAVKNDAGLRYVDRTRRAVERAHNLVADLLDFTRIRMSGSLPVQPESVDLVTLVWPTIDEARAAHPSREIVFESPERALAWADISRMQQVVGNLVRNALQHGDPSAPVKVTITLDGDRWALAVHNEGDPIPAELLDRLFEPLERAQLRSRDGSHSIGLGLYIVREIVRAHHGVIQVTSSAKAGTTFTATLPQHPPH